ncbi:MAG: hypothetical protein LUD54_06645 [Oscillospiraceae bacterium]|nr:hypothetical protein [Oscillospiraceae bacterium]
MKKNSIFTFLLLLLAIAFVGIAVIFILALRFGFSGKPLIDFSAINFANLGIVVFAGFLVMLFVFMAILIILAKICWEKIRDYKESQKKEKYE